MIDFCLFYAKPGKIIPNAIIHKFKDVSTDQVMFDVKNANYILSENKKRMALFYTDDSINTHLNYDPQKKEIHFFDGSFFDGDRHLTDINQISKVPSFMEIGGNYCTGIFSEIGVNFVHETVLGIYNLFWAETKDAFIVSNNPHLIATAIKTSKFPETNMMNFACQISFKVYATGDLGTAYKDVHRFPLNSGVVISENNEIKFRILSDELYVPKSQEDWKKSFINACDNLQKFFSAVRDIDGKFYGNITGGMDSRTALAVALATGVQDKFNFSVRGLETNPDVIVAKDIAKQFNIPLRYDNICNASFKIDKDTYIKNLEFNMRYYCGSATISEMPIQKIYRKKFQYLCTGLSGELLRGFLKSTNFNVFGLYSSEFLDNKSFCYIKHKIWNFFELFPDDPIYFSELYTILIRTPQFHGGIWNRNKIPILANTALHNLAFISDFNFIHANNLNFRLIEHFYPKLLKIPFADKKWNSLNYKNRSDCEEFDKILPICSSTPNPSQYYSSQFLPFLKEYLFEPDEQIFSYLNKKEYFHYINKNYNNLTYKSAFRMLKLVTPTFWINMLKSGKMHYSSLTPISSPLAVECLPKGFSPFSSNQYGSVSFEPKEVLSRNLLILTSPDAIFGVHRKTHKPQIKVQKNFGRMDIKAKSSVPCVEVTENHLPIKPPDWMTKNGIYGGSIQNNTGLLSGKIYVSEDCDIQILLKGSWAQTENERKYVKFTSLLINNEEKLLKPCIVMHDTPESFKIKGRKGDIIEVRAQFKDLNVADTLFQYCKKNNSDKR